MVKKLLLIGSSVALLASQNVAALCLGDIEMHGNKIKNVSVSGLDGSSDAVNKHYVDEYIKQHKVGRLDGTHLSELTDSMTWVKAQEYCTNLESKAIIPGSEEPSDYVYKDWHLPTRMEYISACLAHGSEIDYETRNWSAAGQCANDPDYFWLNTYHFGPASSQVDKAIPMNSSHFAVQVGRAELFNPSTGFSLRDHGDVEHKVRCMR
jgi:hypothetical protein